MSAWGMSHPERCASHSERRNEPRMSFPHASAKQPPCGVGGNLDPRLKHSGVTKDGHSGMTATSGLRMTRVFGTLSAVLIIGLFLFSSSAEAFQIKRILRGSIDFATADQFCEMDVTVS